jgi:hypothetical protein
MVGCDVDPGEEVTSMAIREPTAPLSPNVGNAKGSLAKLVMFAAVVLVAALPPVRADSAPPQASAAKLGPSSTKPARARAEPARATKPTTGKPKARSRVTPKSAKPAPAAAAKPAPAASAKPNQVMDFDTDEVEGKKLEPGFELIEAAPRRARQPSMVTYPPKPEDSMVKGN